MQYYPAVTAGLKGAVGVKYPSAVARYLEVDIISNPFDMVCYLLWMLDEIQKFVGPEMAAKRGRWIGYLQKGFEDLYIVTNSESRNMTRLDVADKKE